MNNPPVQTIKCPHCGESFEPSEAFQHQIEESIRAEMSKKHEEELLRVRKQTEESIQKKIASDFQNRLENIQKDAQEEKERNRGLISELKTLNEQIRILQRKDQERELTMEKKLREEEGKIREDAAKKAIEQSQEEVSELKKQLDDTKKSLESANYKLSQKSQQLQGEVMELDLEKILRETFLDDDIVPVAKGKAGGDIVQKVKGRSGRVAGIILWETKHAKWSPSWVGKLREDARSEGATAAVLVCTHLPKDIEHFQVDGSVVVTSTLHSLAIASMLRRSIIQIFLAKQTVANKDEKLEFLYEYIQSEAFRHRFEAFAEGVKQMGDDLNYERSAMERVWKKRETQIKKMLINASRMYGELQGVMGNALPEIRTFALPEGGAEQGELPES